MAYSGELLQLGPKLLPEYKLDQSIAFFSPSRKKKKLRVSLANEREAWKYRVGVDLGTESNFSFTDGNTEVHDRTEGRHRVSV